MAQIRFVHCADMHLGAKFSMLPRPVANIRRRQQRDALAAAVDVALDADAPADVFLIAGDSFDADTPPVRDQSFFNEQLGRLKEKGVRTFIIPGNHDLYEPGKWWDHDAPPAEKVFREPGPHFHTVASLDLTIAALPVDSSRQSINLLSDLELKIETGRSILLMHGSWLNFGKDECEVACHPFSTEELAKLPVNYVALGHYHGLRDASPKRGPKAFYPGTPEATGFGASCTDAGHIIVGTINDKGKVSVKPRKVGVGRHRKLKIDCTNESPESLIRRVKKSLDENDYVLVELTGAPPAETVVAARELSERLRGSCAYMNVELNFSDLGEGPAENIFFSKYREVIERKLEEASEEDKPKLRRALELGTSAFVSLQDQ